MSQRRVLAAEPSLIDLSIINISSSTSDDPFGGVQNLVVDGPPRVLLDRIVSHLKNGCYRIISLCIGGPVDHRSTCGAVISTSLSREELRRRGFEWHGLDAEEAVEIEDVSLVKYEEVEFDESAELVRINVTNGTWKSYYNLIRGALHHSFFETALVTIKDHINSGCYALEALFAVRNWYSVTIDTDSTQEERRVRGFRWHGLEADGEEQDEDGAIVVPGHSLAGDFWEMTTVSVTMSRPSGGSCELQCRL